MSREASAKDNPRQRALRILTDAYEGQPSAHIFSEDPGDEAQSDTALTAQLVLGITRNRITCEHIAAQFYRGRWESLRPSIRSLYSIGIYQLCWLERIPDHAAVDESVRIARRFGIGVAQMMNAVLRKIAGVRGPIAERPVDADPRRFLAIDENRGRVFSEAIFPDPARRPLEFLVAATSHPPYLVERWHRRFKPALCKAICEAGRRRPPLVVRPNQLRTGSADLLRRLRDSGHPADPLSDSDAIILHGPIRAGDLEEIREGLCQPQDSTSQKALLIAPPQPGNIVLDLCAGVGTKSTQAAELMGNQGVILASDPDTQRLSHIPTSASLLRINIVQTISPQDIAEKLKSLARAPDLILIDAPCSNTGVLARRPEARYRASHKNLMSLVSLQREILQQAIAMCGPHTRIIYSTCSIEREENEEQAAWLAETFPQFRLDKSHLILPDREHDGGFAASLIPAGS